MARKKKGRPRTPEVLRRAYGGHVNTLDCAILSLLPTPSPDSPLDCSCKGQLCLGCLGQSYLFFDEAPSEYIHFLTHSFCFVHPRAPPPPANFSASNIYILHESDFFNVRAIKYEYMWNHLLERVGDEFMAFLLCNSSIFVPLANHKYLQVTGNLLEDNKFSNQKVQKVGDFHCSQLLEVPPEFAIQSSRIGDNRAFNSSCNGVSENPSSAFSLKSGKRKREINWIRRKKHKKLEEAAKSVAGSNLNAEYNEIDLCSLNISKSILMKDKFCIVEEISQGQQKKIISHCLDCILLHCPSKVEMGTDIKRNLMFHVRLSSDSLFPKNHVLNKLKPNNAGAIALLNNIFEVSAIGNESKVLCSCLNSTNSKSQCSCFKASKYKCLFHSLVCLFKALIRNCRRCQYKKLLRRHCMGLVFNENGTICDGSEVECNLIDSYSTHSQVVSFIWAVTRSLIPIDLLGNSTTWRVLRKNISKFVKLRRFEKFSLKQCIYQLKVSHYPFLSKTTFDGNSTVQNKLFRSWMHWYFSHVVVHLLGNNFYITERETRKQDVFYYPRPIWKNLFEKTVSQLKGSHYNILSNSSLEKILNERKNRLGKNQFGFSKVRFLPKEKNLRPLANLKVPSKFLFTRKNLIWYKSVNSVLHELHVVLNTIKIEDREKLGASVFDYNEIYQRLFHFITEMRKESKVFHKLYIVVADVAKAYDSIDQNKLVDIMKDVIPRDTYFFKNYSKFVCTKNSIKAIPCRLGSYHINSDKVIMNIEASIQLNSSCSVLLAKEGTCDNVNYSMLHQVLTEHLKCNILQIGRNYYLQKVGITQGSVLSTLLCSFYFGYLERNFILPFLEKSCESSFKHHNLLLRFIDDFLFISTSKQQAESFLIRLQKGYRDFNCYMNPDKFGFNFDIDECTIKKRFYTGADGKHFIHWSGLLINSKNFEIQADYTRYWRSHLSSTITVQANAKLGCTLQKKLCDYIHPKCFPLFYDSNINSLATVALNAYQAFLLSAMKFHCWACAMPNFDNLKPSYILNKLLFSFRHMYELLKRKMHYVKLRMNVKPILKLRKKEFIWLGLSAYLRALKKKQSRYKELIIAIRTKIAELDAYHTLPYLQYAADDSHSSIFRRIKF